MCFRLCFCRFCAEKKRTEGQPPDPAVCGLCSGCLASSSGEFGVNSLLLNYIFGLYLVVLCANFGADLSKDDWLDIVSGAASILMIVILIKNLIYYQGFWIISGRKNGAPWGVKMIIGGGSNIESSWLGLLAFSSAGAAGNGCMQART